MAYKCQTTKFCNASNPGIRACIISWILEVNDKYNWYDYYDTQNSAVLAQNELIAELRTSSEMVIVVTKQQDCSDKLYLAKQSQHV